MKKVIGIALIACLPWVGLGYILGLKYPARLGVKLDPRPWTATEFYETKLPPGWDISEDTDAGSYGKWRKYHADFDSDASDSVMDAIKARTSLIEKIYTWGYIGTIQVEIRGDTQWRDVDALVYQGLERLKAKSQPSVSDSRLSAASSEWSKALGRTVKVPILHYGSCVTLSIFTVACADRRRNMITVEDRNFEDLHTVYLHELGHILGVSHIKGDALMDSEYSKPTGITPAAIEAAKHPHFDKED
jgi:hypothetical protein